MNQWPAVMWQLESEPAVRPELYTWVTDTRYSGKVHSVQVSEHAVSRWPHAASWAMILKQSETVNPVSSSRPRRSCSLHQHWGWRLPSFNWKTNRHGFQRKTNTHTIIQQEFHYGYLHQQLTRTMCGETQSRMCVCVIQTDCWAVDMTVWRFGTLSSCSHVLGPFFYWTHFTNQSIKLLDLLKSDGWFKLSNYKLWQK